MSVAKFIKQAPGFRGDARIYEVDPPVKFDKKVEKEGDIVWEDAESPYIVVSAVNVLGYPETYIFSSDAEGEVLSWGELEGSFKGAKDHARALKGAGYEVIE